MRFLFFGTGLFVWMLELSEKDVKIVISSRGRKEKKSEWDASPCIYVTLPLKSEGKIQTCFFFI